MCRVPLGSGVGAGGAFCGLDSYLVACGQVQFPGHFDLVQNLLKQNILFPLWALALRVFLADRFEVHQAGHLGARLEHLQVAGLHPDDLLLDKRSFYQIRVRPRIEGQLETPVGVTQRLACHIYQLNSGTSVLRL